MSRSSGIRTIDAVELSALTFLLVGLAYRKVMPGEDDRGRRLDRVLRRVLPETPLGHIFAVIRKGRVRVNGRKVAGGYRIAGGDELEIDESLLDAGERDGTNGRHTSARHVTGSRRASASRRRNGIRRYIVFENEHLLGINKPRGIPVHGREGLDRRVRDYLGNSLPYSLSFRPGPVHRIDRNTTGIVFFGKSAVGARRLGEYLRNGTARKVYLAVLDGELRTPAVWEDRLRRDTVRRQSRQAPDSPDSSTSNREHQAGQMAVTGVYPILWNGRATLALCTIRTGRTHQIRAQAAIHEFPLLGDRKYGGRPERDGYILHSLAFVLPEDDATLGFRYAYADPPASVFERLNQRFGPIPAERILESVTRAIETL